MNNAIRFPKREPLPEPEETVVQAPKEKIVLDERGMIDMPFLLLTALLVLIGLIMMFSASFVAAKYDSPNSPPTLFFKQQVFAVLLGVAAMVPIIVFMNMRLVRILTPLALGGVLVLMFLTPLVGLTGGGATRWIQIGSVSFQPSEFAKLAIILVFADQIDRNKERMHEILALKPFALILGITAISLFMQSHLSATIIIFLVAASMLFQGGVRVRTFVIVGLLMAVPLAIFLVAKGYTMERVLAWRDPFADPQGDGYQIIQSLYAIGSGGLTGVGLGKSRQKYLYLPEGHNDYIFPIICEELGFVGGMVIIILFMMLILRGYWIAMHARDRFSSLVASGITTLIALQVFFNIGVVTNFLPSTGISLPFFSYGGSAMLAQLIEMGLMLRISKESGGKLLS